MSEGFSLSDTEQPADNKAAHFIMTSIQFKERKLGDTLYGVHKGRFFSATIVLVDGNNTKLQYANGSTRVWSKHHMKKYYSAQPYVMNHCV